MHAVHPLATPVSFDVICLQPTRPNLELTVGLRFAFFGLSSLYLIERDVVEYSSLFVVDVHAHAGPSERH